MLAESLAERLGAHRDRLRGLYEQDRAAGLAGVWLPEALERKYPGAGTSWEWFWFFPSRQVSLDPHSGVHRRHHLQDGSFQWAIREAACQARLHKRVTPHTLRTVSPRTCWKAGRISAASRTCSGTWTWRRRRSIPTSQTGRG